jgi:hypothetical protein
MMIAVESRSPVAGLEKKRMAVQAALVQIDEQIQQEEEAQARIKERIAILAGRRREAA